MQVDYLTASLVSGDHSQQAADSFINMEGEGGGNNLHSLPIPESVILQAISELTDGARLAVETCYDLWKEQVDARGGF